MLWSDPGYHAFICAVFIYHRQTKQLPWPGITNITLPCGMKLHIEQLVPNRGREAAVYLHHLITHYGMCSFHTAQYSRAVQYSAARYSSAVQYSTVVGSYGGVWRLQYD